MKDAEDAEEGIYLWQMSAVSDALVKEMDRLATGNQVTIFVTMRGERNSDKLSWLRW